MQTLNETFLVRVLTASTKLPSKRTLPAGYGVSLLIVLVILSANFCQINGQNAFIADLLITGS